MKKPVLLLAAALSAAAAHAPWAQKGDAPVPRGVVPHGPLLPHEQALAGLFEAAAPSVAYITTERLERTGMFTAGISQGAGSGFVWDGEGHVVPNFHVLAGARSVSVSLDAGKPIPAKVVGFSEDYDLAVVKLVNPPKGLRPIPVGTSRDLRIGQAVYAIGNPFGLREAITSKTSC